MKPVRLEISISLLLGVVLLAFPSCEVEDELPGTLGDRCASDMDCEEDMFCAEGGIYQGHCTEECGPGNYVCDDKYGDEAFCHVSFVCVQDCTTARCSGGLVCDRDGIPDHCQSPSYED